MTDDSPEPAPNKTLRRRTVSLLLGVFSLTTITAVFNEKVAEIILSSFDSFFQKTLSVFTSPTPNSLQGNSSYYIPLPNRSLAECRDNIKEWATSSGMDVRDYSKRTYFWMSARKDGNLAYIRCVGSDYSNTTFAFITAIEPYQEFTNKIFELLETRFRKMGTRSEVFWPTTDGWERSDLYVETYDLKLNLSDSEILQWNSENSIPNYFLKTFEDRNIPSICSEEQSKRTCTFRLPRVAISITKSLDEVGTSDHTTTPSVFATLASQDMGVEDIYSDKKEFLGVEARKLLDALPGVDLANSKRVFHNW